MESWRGCKDATGSSLFVCAVRNCLLPLLAAGKSPNANNLDLSPRLRGDISHLRTLLLSLHGLEAAAVEIEQVLSVLLGGARGHGTLKPYARCSRLAISSGGSNELH